MSYRYEYLRNAEQYFKDIAEQVQSFESFLDLGCGEAHISKHLNNYTGVDNDELALSYANKNYKGRFILDDFMSNVKGDFDVLLMIGIPFLLTKNNFSALLKRYNPKVIIVAGISTMEKKIEKIIRGMKYNKIKKTYEITESGKFGKPASEINERIIYTIWT